MSGSGFSGALNHLTLPPLTQTLRTRDTNIALQLVDRVTTEDAVELMEYGSLDVAFVGMPVPATLPTRVIHD